MHFTSDIWWGGQQLFSANTSPRSRLELSEVKDLGLWTNSSLKSSLQCNKAAASAMRVLGMLRRTFTFNSKDLFIFLHKTYVRPLLEYCVQLWYPYLVEDIDTLERVRRRATKLVPEFSKLSYESRLRKLDIYSLYCRRRRGDLIEKCKLLKGYYDVDWLKFLPLVLCTKQEVTNWSFTRNLLDSSWGPNFSHRELLMNGTRYHLM